MSTRSLIGAAALLAALPLVAAAQGARLRGVVYDSLAGRPVAGASVWSERSTRSTTADSLGRFVLDSLPDGEHLIVAGDTLLDRIGLTPSARVTVRGGAIPDGFRLTLATPSRRTLHARLCAAGPAAANTREPGLLFGTVRNASTGARVAGATVQASWLRIVFGGELVVPDLGTVAAPSDSVGRFVLCGLPADTTLQVSAVAGLLGSSGELEIALAPLGVGRMDIAVGGVPDTLAAATELSGDSTRAATRPAEQGRGTRGNRRAAPAAPQAATRLAGPGTLRRQVTDTAGRPLGNVLVGIEEAADGRTGETGHFLLRRLPLGTRTLVVRRIGFAPERVLVEITPRDTAFVRVQARNIRLLATIQVRSPRTSRILTDFERRRRLRFGGAHYFTPKDIGERDIRSIMYQIPSFRVQTGRGGLWEITGPAFTALSGLRCPVAFVIDGWPRSASIEEVMALRPDEIEGIEVYPRGQNAPIRWVPPTLCGPLVLIWTKYL